MKKIFVTLALGLATITFAQQTPQKQNWEQRKAEMQQKQQAHLDKMQKDLNLSEDQVKKVKALQDKRFAEMENQRAAKIEQKKQKMQEMKAKKESHEAEMKNILTPEQYKKWETQRDEKMKERREMMKEKRGNKDSKNRKMKMQNTEK